MLFSLTTSPYKICSTILGFWRNVRLLTLTQQLLRRFFCLTKLISTFMLNISRSVCYIKSHWVPALALWLAVCIQWHKEWVFNLLESLGKPAYLSLILGGAGFWCGQIFSFAATGQKTALTSAILIFLLDMILIPQALFVSAPETLIVLFFNIHNLVSCEDMRTEDKTPKKWGGWQIQGMSMPGGQKLGTKQVPGKNSQPYTKFNHVLKL